jgi:outer membrane protein assembly factor BamB
LDRDSGKVVWKCSLPDSGRASHSSGVIAEIAGKRQMVTFLGETLVGIAVDDGTLLWRESVIDRYWHPNPPIVRGGDLVLINGSGPGMRLVRIARSDDAFQAKELYSVPWGYFDRFHDSAFFIDNHVYEITRVATCIDCEKGEIIWQERVSRRPASATWADGRFYVHASDGVMKLFEASPAGYSEKGTLTLADHQEMSGATVPVVAGGRLYVREDTRLFCYACLPAVRPPGASTSPNRITATRNGCCGFVPDDGPRQRPSPDRQLSLLADAARCRGQDAGTGWREKRRRCV